MEVLKYFWENDYIVAYKCLNARSNESFMI